MGISQKPVKILLVDEDIQRRDLLSSDLKQRGYLTMPVSGWEDALQLLIADKFDLILADVSLLNAGPHNLREWISERRAEVPMIWMADHRNIDCITQVLGSGKFDFILTPILLPELELRMKTLLNAGSQGCRPLDMRSEKLALMGRLVSGMAHEINNPLTAVIGYAQLLLDTGGQDMSRQLKIIKDQAQRCGKIIQDLMLFSRSKVPVYSKVNICEVVNQAVQALGVDIKMGQIQLTVVSPEKDIYMMGDPGLLKRAISHIVTNAIQSFENSIKDRRIEINIFSSEQQVQIEIRDNGCGMSKEEQVNLFEPFYTTREVGKGAGLGLCFCHGVVSGHGGKISVQSDKNKGAIFTLTFPKKINSLQESKIPEIPGKRSQDHPKNILLIEDESFIVDFIRQVVSSHGFEVYAVNDGEKGFEALKSGHFDLVLCDFRIPKMNGLEIFNRIQEQRGGFQNRFILVTASISFAEGMEDKILKEKGILYLPKPFTGDDLMKMIKSCIRTNSHL